MLTQPELDFLNSISKKSNSKDAELSITIHFSTTNPEEANFIHDFEDACKYSLCQLGFTAITAYLIQEDDLTDRPNLFPQNYSLQFHVTANPYAAKNIVGHGINPQFLNPDTRFGKGFYISDDVNTCFKELQHHDCTPAHIIVYRMPPKDVLNYEAEHEQLATLPDPDPNDDATKTESTRYTETKQVRRKAEAFFRVEGIEFNSERGSGRNTVLFFKEVSRNHKDLHAVNILEVPQGSRPTK